MVLLWGHYLFGMWSFQFFMGALMRAGGRSKAVLNMAEVAPM